MPWPWLLKTSAAGPAFGSYTHGVEYATTAAGRAPNGVAGFLIHRDHKAFPAARVFRDKFHVVLLAAENNLVLIENGRNTAPVLADERPKIALPNGLAARFW